MNDAEEFLRQNPGVKLDTDIVEQIPIQKRVVGIDDKGNPTITTKTVVETQTVRYMHVPKVKHRCADGEHIFRVLNNRKYLFACTLCPFVRQVYPTTYRFDEETGKLIHKITGSTV